MITKLSGRGRIPKQDHNILDFLNVRHRFLPVGRQSAVDLGRSLRDFLRLF